MRGRNPLILKVTAVHPNIGRLLILSLRSQLSFAAVDMAASLKTRASSLGGADQNGLNSQNLHANELYH